MNFMNRMYLAALAMIFVSSLLLQSCGERLPAREDNVILVVVDTLRRDHVGAYGSKKGLSPCMDRLAAEGFCFENAVAPSSWTKPSVASILTGRYPGRHGVLGSPEWMKDHAVLSPSLVTLAESMKAAGYRTAAFVTNPHIISGARFDQGFEHFVQPAGNAKELLDKAASWIKDLEKGEKFFLYLHLIDPHHPYAPPEDFKKKHKRGPPGPGAQFAREGFPKGIQLWVGQFKKWRSGPDGDRFAFDYDKVASEILKEYPYLTMETLRKKLRLDFQGLNDPGLKQRTDYLISLYEGEMAFTDAAMSSFLDDLEAKGLLDESILVVTGDHGENFLDHEFWGHGFTVHAEEVDVPLLFRIPGSEGPVRGRIGEFVSLVDIYPTLQDILGLPGTSDLDGVSLWPAMSRGASALPRRPVFSELIRQGMEEVAVISKGMKVIRTEQFQGGGIEWRYFDIERDPLEQDPLAGKDDTFRSLQRTIQALIENRELDSLGGAMEKPLSKEEIEQMKALGYF